MLKSYQNKTKREEEDKITAATRMEEREKESRREISIDK